MKIFEEKESPTREFSHALKLSSGIYFQDMGISPVITARSVSVFLGMKMPVDNGHPETLLFS